MLHPEQRVLLLTSKGAVALTSSGVIILAATLSSVGADKPCLLW
jgi:Na+/H+-dicarboxylate symporter